MCDKNNISALVAIACVLGISVSAAAQRPVFDAASIRRSVQQTGDDLVFLPGGRFTASSSTLELIGAGYEIATFRIVGGPDWMRSERYDVQARAAGDVTLADTRLMLQRLLEERFRLRVRTEPREIPVYALLLARSDRRTGPGLRPASPDACIDRGPLPVNVPRDALPSCGRLFGNPGRMSGRRVSLDLLAERLSTIVGRVVVNQTGRTEMFDVDLEWTPDSGPSFGNRDAPSLLTALGEQLGVKLDSSRAEAAVLLVESIERPTEN